MELNFGRFSGINRWKVDMGSEKKVLMNEKFCVGGFFGVGVGGVIGGGRGG